MLETVREFGLGQLALADDEFEVRVAFAMRALCNAQRLAACVEEPDFEHALTEYDSERDNAISAIAWAVESGHAEIALKLSEAMGRYWAIRGSYQEGRRWLGFALELAPPAQVGIRLRALRSAGWLARLQGDLVAARTYQTMALNESRAAGDNENAAAALQELGLISVHENDTAGAIVQIDEALALLLAVESTLPAGPQLISVVHANLGQIALAAGDANRSRQHTIEAVRRQRALGYTWALGDTLRILGDVAQVDGDHERAMAAYQESIELVRDSGDRRFLANTLAGIADLLIAQGFAERGVRVHAAAQALRDQFGLGIEAWQQDRHERAMLRAEAMFPPERLERARQAGRSLTIEEVIGEALVPSPTNPPRPALPAPDIELTPREVEVLRLVAAGLQDRQIAETLFIAPRTASFHVANLLAKLGVDSRSAAAAYAVRNGLA